MIIGRSKSSWLIRDPRAGAWCLILGQPVTRALPADLGGQQGGECKDNRPNAQERMEHDIRWNPDRSEWVCARCQRTSDHTRQRDAEIEIMQFKCVPQPNTPHA